jgi:hypothetical protein
MKVHPTSIAGRIAVFLVAATATSLFFINLCGTIFQCGCQSLWAGADQHCNVHQPAGKHCPWCSPSEAGYAAYGAMIGTQAILSFVPRGWNWRRRLLSSVAAFPVVGLVLGLAFGIGSGYWD